MGNNVSCKVIGIGTIKMKLEDGTSKILTGVKTCTRTKTKFNFSWHTGSTRLCFQRRRWSSQGHKRVNDDNERAQEQWAIHTAR